MEYPNALKGVKRLYRAEIIALIGGALIAAAALIYLFRTTGVKDSDSKFSDAYAASLMLAMMVVSGVLYCISFIVRIRGLAAAKSDEENFRFALYACIVGLAASILNGVGGGRNELISTLCNTILKIASLFAVGLVCTAILKLAERLDRDDVAKTCEAVRNLLLIGWGISVLLELFSSSLKLIGASRVLGVLAAVLSLASAVVSVAVDIMFLKTLRTAKEMLRAERNEKQ